MEWEEVGFVKASRIRESILRELSSKPKSPKDITDALHVYFPQVSKQLKLLKEKGLITSLTSSARTKGRLYGITPTGLEVLEKLG